MPNNFKKFDLKRATISFCFFCFRPLKTSDKTLYYTDRILELRGEFSISDEICKNSSLGRLLKHQFVCSPLKILQQPNKQIYSYRIWKEIRGLGMFFYSQQGFIAAFLCWALVGGWRANFLWIMSTVWSPDRMIIFNVNIRNLCVFVISGVNRKAHWEQMSAHTSLSGPDTENLPLGHQFCVYILT